MQFLDEIKLGFGHNLVVGFLPKKITLDQLAEIISKENHQSVEKFGLFENSTPNYTTFYPEVTAEDLVPEEGDFIEPIFRALSEVIVHKSFNPVDFSMNGVLKKSMNLLSGQTINADHETALGNAMGAISQVSWQDSYKAGAVQVPAGINAKLKIDGKSNPRIARGIMMDPPSIHSTSVTVQFLWEKSHDMPENEFFSKLATFDKDGNMYRRIASSVKSYREISLVGHGADPFAQKVGKDGMIVNPKYAGIAYNSDSERAQAQGAYNKKEKYFFFDLREDIIYNSEKPTIPEESNEEEITNTDINMKPIALLLGLKDTATEAEILLAITALTDANSAANTQITSLKAAAPDAAKVTELQSFMDNTMTTRRNDCVALYNKTTKTPDAATITLIGKANAETLQLLEGQYKAEIERLYPAKCKKCGGTEISRASTVANEEESEGGEETLTYRERLEQKQRDKYLNIRDSGDKKEKK